MPRILRPPLKSSARSRSPLPMGTWRPDTTRCSIRAGGSRTKSVDASHAGLRRRRDASRRSPKHGRDLVDQKDRLLGADRPLSRRAGARPGGPLGIRGLSRSHDRPGQLPIALGWYAELEWNRIPQFDESQLELELKPIIEKDIGRLEIDLNPKFVKAIFFGPDKNKGFEFGYVAGAYYNYWRPMSPG